MFKKTPIVTEVKLGREYAFMYENFLLATQSAVYLLLEKKDDTIFALRFDSPNCKYGGPNDEAHAGHPLSKNGLGSYGLFVVENSPWISEMMMANRVHPRHADSLFAGRKHYIACFKDVKFESVCRKMEEVALSKKEFAELVESQLSALED